MGKKKTVGGEIIDALTGFVDDVKNGKLHEYRRIKVVDLTPSDYTAADVVAVRRAVDMSQSQLARLMGVSVKTVQSWEHGYNTPAPIARRFLDEIRHNPAYWVQRYQDSIMETAE